MIRRYILSTVCSSFCSRIIPKQRLSSSRPYICSSQHVHCILFVPWHNTQSSLLLVLSSQRRRRSKQQQQNVCTGDYHAPVFHITTASSTTICRRRTTSERRSIYIYIYIVYIYIVWPQLSSSRESEPRVEAHNMASSTFSRGPTASSHYYSGHQYSIVWQSSSATNYTTNTPKTEEPRTEEDVRGSLLYTTYILLLYTSSMYCGCYCRPSRGFRCWKPGINSSSSLSLGSHHLLSTASALRPLAAAAAVASFIFSSGERLRPSAIKGRNAEDSAGLFLGSSL